MSDPVAFKVWLPPRTELRKGDLLEVVEVGENAVLANIVFRSPPAPVAPPDIGIAVSDGMGVSDRLR
jgi:hypothetical protein